MTQNAVIVGVGDCQVSSDPCQELVTYALGSCIAVAIYDPLAGVGGLLHFMLPESAIDRAKAALNPYMSVDTGIPRLFHSAYGIGAEKGRLQVHVAAGAQVMDDGGVFNIGKRNYLALRKILWKAGVLVQSESVGGSSSRTVRLELSTGRVWMRGPDFPEQELSRVAGRI